MLLGRLEEAWRESDAIAARGGHDPNRFWDGRPFAGGTVLIRCLHGLGDTIQFSRYVRLVRAEAARVILQVHPQLVTLMRGLPFADEVITWPDPPGLRWDQQIEVMELPRAFRTTLETIPAETPYLYVCREHEHRTRVPRQPGVRPRVGLQWGSGVWNAERSIPLGELLPALDPDVADYFSFQRAPECSQLNGCPLPIEDVSGDCVEIVEAAADLMHIDLLITADTMLAHLAGALGRQVWVLLPWAADWRWMENRTDSPWYPTMRLFRQSSQGDWSSAVCQLGEALRQLWPSKCTS